MHPGFIICGIIAVIEIYYWFFWFPKNKHYLEQYKDWENYIEQVWEKGHGVK